MDENQALRKNKMDYSQVEKKFNDHKALVSFYNTIKRQIDNTDSYPLNVSELKNICYYGFCTDEIRSKIWKILLEYKTNNKFKNQRFYSDRRSCYTEYYKNCLKILEEEPYHTKVLNNDMERKILSPKFEKTDEGTRKICEILDAKNEKNETHREVIKRILLTFKITNVSVGYVQGMCNLLFPIYFVFLSSDDNDERENVEADTYFCFFNLMSEIGEFFISKMDNDKELGINSKLIKVFEIVKFADKKLYEHLFEIGLVEKNVHLSWVNLLFTSQFNLSEVIWLWDRFLGDCQRFEIVLYSCASVFLLLKKDLRNKDFCGCMEVLSNKEKINPFEIFKKADELRKEHYKAK